MNAQLELPATRTITLDADTAGELLELLTVSAGNVMRLAYHDPYAFSGWQEALEKAAAQIEQAGAVMPERRNVLRERMEEARARMEAQGCVWSTRNAAV